MLGVGTSFNSGWMTHYHASMPEAARRYGSNRLGGDYAGVARSLGAHAERVERPAEVAPAVAGAVRANAAGRPAVLEMITREEEAFPKFWPDIG